MIVRELIHHFRTLPNQQPGREDARHARWWIRQIGDEDLPDVTTATLLALLERLAGYGRSPSTVGKYLRFLMRVTAWGTSQGYLAKDPCAGMVLPRERRCPHLRVLTDTEEKALCAALGEPYSLWVRFAVLTGLKQSEQFTLRWRDVDLTRAVLLLPHPTTGAMVELKMPAEAVEILRQLRVSQAPSIWVFPDPKNPFRPVNIHSFYTGRWATAVDRARIPWIAWRDLRHTRGVRLAQSGASIDDVDRQMRLSENRRRAYLYRNWRPDGPPLTRPTHPRQPVFTDLEEGTLRDLMTRDLTTAPLIFSEAAHLYATHHLRQRPTRAQFERCYKQFWMRWVDRPLSSISKKEVLLWYWGLKRTPSHAHKALTLFRSMYGWCLRLELVTGTNPAVGLPAYPQLSRERFLSVEELQRFMEGLPYLPAKPRAYLLVLLLTAARRSEARMMRWEDIDFALRLWRKGRTKNGTSQFQPLPAQLIEVLQRLPRINSWIFPGQNGQPWSAGTAEKVWCAIRQKWAMDDVTLHDLRRTCASYLAITGENLPTIQHILNHRSLTPTSIYTRLNVQAVDRALQQQADRLFAIDQSNPSIVERDHPKVDRSAPALLESAKELR